MKVPDYFKSFDKPITLPGFEHHRERWFDEWGHINSEEAEAMLPRRDKFPQINNYLNLRHIKLLRAL